MQWDNLSLGQNVSDKQAQKLVQVDAPDLSL